MEELWRESALSLAQLIRSGEVSSREVAESHLARIDEVNATVNAVVEVRPDAIASLFEGLGDREAVFDHHDQMHAIALCHGR